MRGGQEKLLVRRVDATGIDDINIHLEAPTQVEEEPVIANREVRTDGRIPNVAETFFSFGPSRLLRSLCQEGGWIVWVERLPRLALCDAADSNIDVAIGAFAVVRGATLSVIDDLALLLEVERSCGRGPLPAVHAAISSIVEIIKIYEIGAMACWLGVTDCGTASESDPLPTGRSPKT